MTDTTIPCDEETKSQVSDIQEELNEEESYYVTQDLVVQELIDSYHLLSRLMDKSSKDKIKNLAEGKASITVHVETGKGQGQGNGAMEDEGKQTNK
jgi:hypothetical protein